MIPFTDGKRHSVSGALDAARRRRQCFQPFRIDIGAAGNANSVLTALYAQQRLADLVNFLADDIIHAGQRLIIRKIHRLLGRIGVQRLAQVIFYGFGPSG